MTAGAVVSVGLLHRPTRRARRGLHSHRPPMRRGSLVVELRTALRQQRRRQSKGWQRPEYTEAANLPAT